VHSGGSNILANDKCGNKCTEECQCQSENAGICTVACTQTCGKHFCQTITKLHSGSSRGKEGYPWPPKCTEKCLCFIRTVHVIVTMHRYASLYIVKLWFDNLFNNIRVASLCDTGVYGDNYVCQVCDPHLKLWPPFPCSCTEYYLSYVEFFLAINNMQIVSRNQKILLRDNSILLGAQHNI